MLTNWEGMRRFNILHVLLILGLLAGGGAALGFVVNLP